MEAINQSPIKVTAWYAEHVELEASRKLSLSKLPHQRKQNLSAKSNTNWMLWPDVLVIVTRCTWYLLNSTKRLFLWFSLAWKTECLVPLSRVEWARFSFPYVCHRSGIQTRRYAIHSLEMGFFDIGKRCSWVWAHSAATAPIIYIQYLTCSS